MTRLLSILARALLYTLLGVLGLLGVLVLALWIPASRERIVREGLRIANDAMAGYKVELERVHRLSPWGVSLQGVRVSDPEGRELAHAHFIAVDLAPSGLFAHKVVLPRVQIDRVRARYELPSESTPSEETESAPSGWSVHVQALEIRDVHFDTKLGELPLHAHLGVLRARGAFSDTPSAQLSALTLRVSSNGNELLHLRETRGAFDEARGGELTLEGAVAHAPLHLSAKVPGLEHQGAWPLHEAELTLTGLTREALIAFGVADGGELKAPVNLRARARAVERTLQAQADLETSGTQLALTAEADDAHLRASAELEPSKLSGVSSLLPDLRVGARLRVEAERENFPSKVALSWSDVEIDGKAVPNGSLALLFDLPRITLERTTLQGLERSLMLSGSYDLTQQHAHVKLDLSALRLATLAPLVGQELSGLVDGGVRVNLDGEKLSGRSTLRLEQFAHPSARLERLDVDLRLGGQLSRPEGSFELTAQRLEASGRRIDHVNLKAHATAHSLDGTLSLRGDAARVEATLKGTRRPDGSLYADAAGEGRIDQKTVRFELKRLALEPRLTAVERLSLAAGAQSVELSGSLKDQRRAQLQLKLARVQVGEWASLAGVEGLSGELNGSLEVEGLAAKPRVRANVELRKLRMREHPAIDATLALNADLSAGAAETELRLHSPDVLEARVSGAMELPRASRDLMEAMARAQYRLELSARGSVKPLTDLALGTEATPLLAVHGRWEAALGARGTLKAPEAEADVKLDLGLRDAGATGPSGALTDSVRLSATLTPSAARVGLSLRDRSGPLFSLESAAAFPGQDVYALQKVSALHQLQAELRARLERRDLRALQGVFGYYLRAYAPELPMHAALELSARSDKGELSATTFATLELHDQALDEKCAQSARTKLELRGELANERLAVALTGTSNQAPSRIAVQLDSPLSLTQSGAPALQYGPADVRVKGSEVALTKLPGLCNLSGGQAQFALEGRGLGSRAPQTQATLELTGLSYQDSPPVSLRARASSDDKHARLEGQIGVQGRDAGNVTAEVPLVIQADHVPALAEDRPLSATLAILDLPLSVITAATDALGRPNGTASIDFKLSGTARAPQPSGSVVIRDAAFSIAALAQPFRDVNAKLALEGRKVTLSELSARDRSGQLSLQGYARLHTAGSGEAQLFLSTEKFPLRQQGTVIGELTTRVKVTADMNTEHRAKVQARVVSGRVWLTGEGGSDVQSLDPHPHVRFAEDLAVPSAPPKAPEAPAFALESLNIATDKDIWLMHEDFSVQLGVAIDVTNQGSGPKLRGEASLRRGELALLGKPFRLERGAVRFTGDIPPDPELDIRATHKPPSGQPLLVHVGGRASAPQLTFSGAANNVGDAIKILSGLGGSGSEAQAQSDASAFAAGVTAGLLSVAARREFGDWVPMITIENTRSGAPGRARAGFDATNLIPRWMQGFARGAYVEGVVGTNESSARRSTGVGVRLELALPQDFVTSMGYGPGSTWSTDVMWSP